MKLLENFRSSSPEEQLGLERHTTRFGYAVLGLSLTVNLGSVGIAISKGSLGEFAIALGWTVGSSLAISAFTGAAETRMLQLRHELGLETSSLTEFSLPLTDLPDLEDKEPNPLDDWEDDREEDPNDW